MLPPFAARGRGAERSGRAESLATPPRRTRRLAGVRRARWLLPPVMALAVAATSSAHAEELPAGSIGAVLGVQAGASGSADALGVGVVYGLTAAWQPMTDEQRFGWGVRWSVRFGYFPDSSSAAVSDVLRLVELDVAARLRVALTARAGRTLTAGAGVSLLRTNEPVLPELRRAFAGPIVTMGYEHLAWGAALVAIDLRYGIIETGPTSIGLLVSIGTAL